MKKLTKAGQPTPKKKVVKKEQKIWSYVMTATNDAQRLREIVAATYEHCSAYCRNSYTTREGMATLFSDKANSVRKGLDGVDDHFFYKLVARS